MTQDVIYAIRGLIRDRRFSAAVVAILALGIGADLAVYALVSAILVRPLPFTNPDQLVRLWETNQSAGIPQSPVSDGTFQDWRRELKSFAYIEAFEPRPRDAIVQIGGEPEIVRQTAATDGFLRMLGVSPVLGPASQGRVSERFWTRRFARSPSVIGTTMIVEGFTQYPVTIDGVLPKTLDVLAAADLWARMRLGDQRAYRGTYVIGRLKAGVTLTQAQAELDAMSGQFAEHFPAQNSGWRGVMQPLKDSIVMPARTPLILLYVSVSLLLLIAASNVAILSAVRRLGRRRIVSIQLALGATRARLLVQTLVESAGLVGTATAAGLLVAAWLLTILKTLAPASIPRLVEVRVSADVVGAAAAIGCLVTLLVCAVASIHLRLSVDDLRVAGAGPTGARSATVLRSALVRVEIAACACLVLVTCGTVRSFIALERTPLGFDPHNVLLVDVRQPIMKGGEHVKHYPTQRFVRTAAALTTYAASLPGVQGAAAGVSLPLSGTSSHAVYRFVDREIVGPLPDGSVSVTGPGVRRAVLRLVDAGFFRVSRTPILTGRAFEPLDRLADNQFDDFDAVRGAGAAIVSAAFARQFGALPSIVDRYLAVEGASYPSVRIVGVAADVVSIPGEAPEPTIYLPYAQYPMDRFTLLVRAADPKSIMRPLSAYLHTTVGADVSAFNIRSYDDVVHASLAQQRFSSDVMGFFAIVAVGFTAVALYSVLALVVALRRRELAIRTMLGATPRVLVTSVLRDGAALTAVGLGAGLAAAVVFVRTLGARLPDVHAPTMADASVTAVAVLLVSFLSSYRPARAAASADPLTLVKSE